jgi:hypothetical protein
VRRNIQARGVSPTIFEIAGKAPGSGSMYEGELPESPVRMSPMTSRGTAASDLHLAMPAAASQEIG